MPDAVSPTPGDAGDSAGGDSTGETATPDTTGPGDTGPVLPDAEQPGDAIASDDVPPSDAVAADNATGDIPIADIPIADTPTADTPIADIPTGDIPTGDTPTADAAPDTVEEVSGADALVPDVADTAGPADTASDTSPGLPDVSPTGDIAEGDAGAELPAPEVSEPEPEVSEPEPEVVAPDADETPDSGPEVSDDVPPPCVDDCDPESSWCAPSGLHLVSCVVGPEGCLVAGEPTACDDGDLCTGFEMCSAGACLSTEPLDCTDGDPCTDDGCTPEVGCEHGALTGAACDDGELCTHFDKCTATATCAGVLDVLACDCLDDDDCPTPDDLCQASEVCVGHICVEAPETAVTCDTGDDTLCSSTACEPSTGLCKATAAPDGTPCDDGAACTVNDDCDAGSCGGSKDPGCLPDNLLCEVSGVAGETALCEIHALFGAPVGDGAAALQLDVGFDAARLAFVRFWSPDAEGTAMLTTHPPEPYYGPTGGKHLVTVNPSVQQGLVWALPDGWEATRLMLHDEAVPTTPAQDAFLSLDGDLLGRTLLVWVEVQLLEDAPPDNASEIVLDGFVGRLASGGSIQAALEPGGLLLMQPEL